MAPCLPKRKQAWALLPEEREKLKNRAPLTLEQLKAAASEPETVVLPKDLEQLAPQWPKSEGNKFVSAWQCAFNTAEWGGKACNLRPSKRTECGSMETAATHIRRYHFPGFTLGYGQYGGRLEEEGGARVGGGGVWGGGWGGGWGRPLCAAQRLRRSALPSAVLRGPCS